MFKREGNIEEAMEVACGSCIGCRLDRSRMWAMRITHEAGLYDGGNGNAFVTLTYRPKSHATPKQLEKGEHIPDDWSLNKKHFQDFMKRLRKAYPDRRIKYYHTGS